ncbi:hypothetical protein [Haloarchaeobius sp. DFWS5]|uniref:hypothetical protein n=1 Tax=Haloarchaeobius sp. DFWS5 TaxID=3446114 RepID=UPI003EC055E1
MNRRTAAALALAIGLLLAAHPFYLDVKPGETKVYLHFDPADGQYDEERIVNFTDLPEPSKEAARTARTDGEAGLWIDADSETIEPLATHDYVRWDGQLYRSRVEIREGLVDRVDTVVSPLVSLVGVLLALIGVRTFWDDVSTGPDTAPKGRD